MATMKGLLVAKPGAPYKLSEGIEQPKPGKKQILVKSLVTGINHVDSIMQGTGLLVTAWPIVLGCDASGVVVKVGEGVEKFKAGDGVFGCAQLGVPGHGTFQEFFLMDEGLAFKRPTNVSAEEAATIGAGLMTASLGLLNSLQLQLPEQAVKFTASKEWLLVLGGAGSVGQYAIQIAKICGYNVLTSCSPANNELVKAVGANATFSYKLSLENQLKEIKSITKNNYRLVIDTSAAAMETALKALDAIDVPEKAFATVDNWTPMEPQPLIKVHRLELGIIGRDGNDEITATNKALKSYIPKLEKLLEKGELKPNEYETAGTGLDGVVKGIGAMNEDWMATSDLR
ncbi:chaperonin 10-like protein [Bisporella sp. PMI_857]|nr:chaperonin 10-like protein [Bisporella sp. PMI_857]